MLGQPGRLWTRLNQHRLKFPCLLDKQLNLLTESGVNVHLDRFETSQQTQEVDPMLFRCWISVVEVTQQKTAFVKHLVITAIIAITWGQY